MAEYIERQALMEYADSQPGGLISNKCLFSSFPPPTWRRCGMGGGKFWRLTVTVAQPNDAASAVT